MRQIFVSACVIFAALSLLCCVPVNLDRMAWEDFADISAAASSGALPSESPVGWRLWTTQDELYPGPDTETPPDAAEIHAQFRRLFCGLQQQKQAAFNTGAEKTLDGQPQCEVVFLNQAAARYILDRKLYLRRNLIKAAQSQDGIHLPQAGADIAREIKTEWRRIEPSQFSRYVVAMDNSDPPQPYGLVAIHLMTHEQPKWLWATWIHVDYKGYMQGFALHDSFGADAHGGNSPALDELLTDRKVPLLRYYKLIGTQSDPGKPTLLGNPLIEGKHLERSSCMGCHAYAGLYEDGTWPIPSTAPKVGRVSPLPNRFSADFDFTLVGKAKCHGEAGCKDSI